MAKQKFDRTKLHRLLLTEFRARATHLSISLISTRLRKRESVVSQSRQLTLSMRQRRDIMHTLTAQAMLTMSRT